MSSATAETSLGAPAPAPAARPEPGWRQAEHYLAQLVVVLLGVNRVYRAGATYGEILALLILPLWVGWFRRYRFGVTYLVLGSATLLWGLLLRDFSATDHLVNAALSRDDSIQLLGVVLGVGVLLWARTLLSNARIGVCFGVGMLAEAVLDRSGWADNPWKFAFAIPVSIAVIGAVAGARRGSVQVAALAGLALVSVVLDSRAYSATLALVAVFVLWRRARGRAVAGLSRLRIALLIGAVAVATYLLATSLLVNGYLGRDAQVRTVEQIQTSGSLLLGGRPELAATIALMKDDIAGFGVGVVPTPHDILVAKSGLAGINYAPNNGYVERYMFGGQFELHSVIGDVWARWGVAGLILIAFVLFIVLRSIVEAVSGGHGDVLTIFLCCWTVWNLAFSPFVVSAPVLLLAVGLSLRRRPG